MLKIPVVRKKRGEEESGSHDGKGRILQLNREMASATLNRTTLPFLELDVEPFLLFCVVFFIYTRLEHETGHIRAFALCRRGKSDVKYNHNNKGRDDATSVSPQKNTG